MSQGPTVPEHRANIENTLNTLLAYRPYRPYTSFTPHNEDEGHSSRSPRRVCNSTPLSPQSNIASLQSTALTGSLRGQTESLSPPATVSLTPTSHPSSLATAQVPSTALVLSSSATAQVTTEDTSLNDALMDDAPVDDAPMDEYIPTATPFPHPKPTFDVPTGSGRQKALPLPSTTENYMGQSVNQQFAQLSDKIVVPALRSAVDAMLPTIIELIAGEIKSIHSACSHNIPPALTRPKKYRGTSEEDSEPDCNDDLTPSPRRKHPGKQGIKNQLHVRLKCSK